MGVVHELQGMCTWCMKGEAGWMHTQQITEGAIFGDLLCLYQALQVKMWLVYSLRACFL